MENKLINITKDIATSIKTPEDFVKAIDLEQAAQMVAILKLWNRDTKKDKEAGKVNFMKALEAKIYNSTLNEWHLVLPDGTIWEAKVVRGKEVTKTEKKIIHDFDKAIEFAKANNLELPMTERIVIEPQVDKTKLEMMDWYQENADKFIRVEYVDKPVISSNNIRFKEIKQEKESE